MAQDIIKETNEDIISINYLTPDNAEFYDNNGGLVGLRYNGEDYKTVNVYRAFPHHSLNEFIVIRTGTGIDEREIGEIRNLDEFDDTTKKLLINALNQRYFTPHIIKVNSIKEKCAFYFFDVETDAGHKVFPMFYLFKNIRQISDGSICLTDADRNRYIIDKNNKIAPKYLKYIRNYI